MVSCHQSQGGIQQGRRDQKAVAVKTIDMDMVLTLQANRWEVISQCRSNLGADF